MNVRKVCVFLAAGILLGVAWQGSLILQISNDGGLSRADLQTAPSQSDAEDYSSSGVFAFVENPDATICIGKSRCKSPAKWLAEGSSTLWTEYARPSMYRDSDDRSTWSKCCHSCNLAPSCSRKNEHIRFACDPFSGCGNSEGEEQAFVHHILPYFTAYARAQEPSFLEVGGNDGVHQSNTIFLERCLKWKGILVEAHPSLYYKLRKYRPGVVSIKSALCESHTVVKFAYGPKTDAGILSGNDSNVKKGFRVPCAPLRDYLKLLGVTHISFFSLDVEGFEDHVLASIDFGSVAIGVFVVEELIYTEAKNEAVRLVLAKLGYHLGFRLCRSTKKVHNKVCDAYFVNRSWVDVEALENHVRTTEDLRNEELTRYVVRNSTCLPVPGSEDLVEWSQSTSDATIP